MRSTMLRSSSTSRILVASATVPHLPWLPDADVLGGRVTFGRAARRVDRQRDEKAGPDRDRFERDRSAVGLDDPPGDGQAEPRSRAALPAPDVGLEEALGFTGRKAGTAVGDPDRGHARPVAATGPDLDRRARRRVTERALHEVDEDLPAAAVVSQSGSTPGTQDHSTVAARPTQVNTETNNRQSPHQSHS